MNLQLKEDIQTLRALDEKLRDYEFITGYLETFFEQSPLPSWIKMIDKQGNLRMFRVNKAYEDVFGIQRSTYRTLPDEIVWGEEESDAFHENDIKCISTKLPVQISEPLANPKTGQDQICKGWKWPITNDKGDVIAVFGMVSDLTDV